MMWYPKGVRAFVQSKAIGGGLIYIGPPGETIDGIRASSIDPTLPVSETPLSPLDRPQSATRYEELTPVQRSIYLEWLNTGRSSTRIHEQYVYVYLFGLEYRIRSHIAALSALRDINTARRIVEREGPVLKEELVRLAGIFADSRVLKANVHRVRVKVECMIAGLPAPPDEPLTAPVIEQVEVQSVVPAAPLPRQRWYRAGEVLESHGVTITAGLIYAGVADSISDTPEPSSIDPTAPGIPGYSTDGSTLPFRELSRKGQDAYIQWHAEGRHPVLAEPWMGELYLWGLERRVMLEGWHYGLREAWDDLPAIEASLVDMTRSGSTRRAEPDRRKTAAALLQMTRILRVLTGQAAPDTLDVDPARFNPAHRAAIYDLRGEPWPEELAFALLQEGHRPNPDFFRAHAPFARQQFRLHYKATVHGRCMDRAGTKEIVFSYIAASPALREVAKFGFPNLIEPDLKGDRMLPALGVLRQIQSTHAVAVHEIVGESASELGMTWHFLLPAEQRSNELRAALHRFASGISAEVPTSMFLAGLMANLGCNVPRKSHHILCCFVDALDEAGVALEPDPREAGQLPAREMLVTPFRCAPGSPRSLSPSGVLYGLAVSVIDWIAMKLDVALDARTVIASKGIDSLQDISDSDRTRLQIQVKAGKHLAPLSGAENFVVINATLQESHRAFIERGFEALGSAHYLDRRTADRRLKPLYASGLLRVTPPPTPRPVTRPRSKLVLDKGKIREIIEDTERASRILAPLFAAADEPEPLRASSSAHPWGLDEHHAAFLLEMVASAPLSLEAARTIALRYDLMFDGAAERINEAAIEHAGDAIFEVDGDRVVRTGVEAPT